MKNNNKYHGTQGVTNFLRLMNVSYFSNAVVVAAISSRCQQ